MCTEKRRTVNQTIIRALPADSEQLSEIAYAAKGHWGYPDFWMAEWREEFRITTPYIQDNAVYKTVVMLADGKPDIAGFYALAALNAEQVLDHLWIRPQFMGKGIGRALFDHAVQMARYRGANQIVFDADPNAEGFYLHIGAQRIGQRSAPIDDKPRFVPRMVYIISPQS